MISAPLPDNEAERLRVLEQLNILDTIEEQAYDDLTLIASQICDTPIALVSLIDRERQWFKSHHGLAARETPREYAFCAHAILGDETFVVDDAEQDERFYDNTLVIGEPHVKFYAGVPLVLENKVKVGTLCVIDDHARKLSEDQQQALEALSRQVVSQLELRLKVKELTMLDTAKDEFISMVSHELRTPLTSIYGSLSILSKMMQGSMEAEAENLVGVAYRNSEHLLDIVNDILDAARIDAGKMELHMQSQDILALVREAIELNKPYLKKCECEIEVQLPDDVAKVEVLADRNRLLQVMSNLLSNAAKFTAANDTIIVKVGLEVDKVCISVTDHGVGIPEEFQQHVFARFAQIPVGTNLKLPGTGLGLNICKAIIEQHQGSIHFKVQQGEYTCFYFYLPLAH